MTISAIVCTDANGGIGKDNTIPWNNKEDMAFFKHMTTGKIVIMGSKTYWSLPDKFRPLPDRFSVVYTSNTPAIIQDAYIRRTSGNVIAIGDSARPAQINDDTENILHGLALSVDEYGQYKTDEVFIIGGASIYKQFMHIIDRLYINVLPEAYECDTFFPPLSQGLVLNDSVKYDTFISHTYLRE